jgi:hypothetical protein
MSKSWLRVVHAAEREHQPFAAYAVAQRLEKLLPALFVGLRERAEERNHRRLVRDLAETDGRLARDLDRRIAYERRELREPLGVARAGERRRDELPNARVVVAYERRNLVDRHHPRHLFGVERGEAVEARGALQVPELVLGEDRIERRRVVHRDEREADLRLVAVVGLGERLFERRLRAVGRG